jgi:hypothetical protein
MQRQWLIPLVRSELVRLLNGYVQSIELTEKVDEYVVPARLANRAGILGASFALVMVLVGGLVFAVTKLYIPVANLQEQNKSTLEKIHCEGETCDVAEIANDWDFAAADYVLDRVTYFFLNVDTSAADFRSLRHSDSMFVLRFQSPATVSTPAKESWRLLSTVKQRGSRRPRSCFSASERQSRCGPAAREHGHNTFNSAFGHNWQ